MNRFIKLKLLYLYLMRLLTFSNANSNFCEMIVIIDIVIYFIVPKMNYQPFIVKNILFFYKRNMHLKSIHLG